MVLLVFLQTPISRNIWETMRHDIGDSRFVICLSIPHFVQKDISFCIMWCIQVNAKRFKVCHLFEHASFCSERHISFCIMWCIQVNATLKSSNRIIKLDILFGLNFYNICCFCILRFPNFLLPMCFFLHVCIHVCLWYDLIHNWKMIFGIWRSIV